MTRLWDRLLDAGLKDAGFDPEQSKLLREHVPVYDITNVVRLYLDTKAQYQSLDDFPFVAPPHLTYWMEWRWQDKADSHIDNPKRVALLFHVLGEDEGWDGEGAHGWIVTAIGYWQRKPERLCQWKLIVDEAGGLSLFDAEPASGIRHMHARSVARDINVVNDKLDGLIALRELIETGDREKVAEALEIAGRLEKELEMDRDRAIAEMERINVDLDKVLVTLLEYQMIYPALLTHSLLNCKNVETETHVPPAKLSNRHRRKKGTPLVTFKTLKVNPMGKRSSGGGGERVDIGEGCTALHIVRGHFKTYTPDRPLLGRHVGTYWWASNVRGSADNGIVIKDYEVEL